MRWLRGEADSLSTTLLIIDIVNDHMLISRNDGAYSTEGSSTRLLSPECENDVRPVAVFSNEEGVNTRRGLGDAGERIFRLHVRVEVAREITDGNGDFDQVRIDEPVSRMMLRRTGVDRDRGSRFPGELQIHGNDNERFLPFSHVRHPLTSGRKLTYN